MTVFKKKKRIIKLNAIKCRLVIIMYWIEYIFDKSGLYASFIVNMTQLSNIIVFGAKKKVSRQLFDIKVSRLQPQALSS